MNTFSNLDLVASLDLCHAGTEEKPVYQFVYGSQLYLTLFAIFARFKIRPSSDGTTCEILELSLRLLNYQGIVNIGFKGPVTHSIEDNNHMIRFGVQGTSIDDDNGMRFATPLVVRKGVRSRIIFNRKLYPLPGFEFDASERNRRDPSDPLQTDMPSLTLFDTEFQYRSGIGYYDHALRPGMHGREPAPTDFKFPSARCHESNVDLYF